MQETGVSLPGLGLGLFYEFAITTTIVISAFCPEKKAGWDVTAKPAFNRAMDKI